MLKFAYDYDTALMPNTTNQKAFFDDYIEVVFLDPAEYSKAEAAQQAIEEIKALPYTESIKQPTEDDVLASFIKENPAFDANPEEEDAYLYTDKLDPDAMRVWEVQFIKN